MDIHDFVGATIAKVELLGNDSYDTSIKIICTNGLELLILPDSPAYDHWLSITMSQPSRVSGAIADAMATAKELLTKVTPGRDHDDVLQSFKALAECWVADVINGQAHEIEGSPKDEQVELTFSHVSPFCLSRTKFDVLVSAGVLEVEAMPQWKRWKNWYVSCPVLIDSLEKVEAI